MVFLTGPRQVGKTHFARAMMGEFSRPQYLNYDVSDDARIIRERSWPLTADLLVLDELHKMPGWKQYLKGVFDGRAEDQALLVTGSARMETFRQAGESLAGRYFHFHLLPFSVRELAPDTPPRQALDLLMRLGGFPEPLLSGSEETAARWRRQYATDLVREDVLEFGRIQEVRTMRNLLELLRRRVGSPLSIRSLAEDLHVSAPTVKRYVEILEALYIVFLLRPHHDNVARSLRKEPKPYFYDTGLVLGDEGARLENACAVCLLKHSLFVGDSTGKETALRYLRTKDGREADFALVEDGQVREVVEVKLSDPRPSQGLAHFGRILPEGTRLVQIVHNLAKAHRAGAVELLPACDYLAGLAA